MLSFYNSRSKQIEKFDHDKSIPINIYTCGPTVYDRVHLGNLKTFLWSDMIVSILQALDYKTNHIMNITDIDDKIISRLPEQTMTSLLNFTNTFTNHFISDMKSIGAVNYNENNIHKVSDNIDDMENMVLKLIENGYAYETKDGSVYFDSSKINNNPFYVENNTENYVSNRNIIRSDDIKNNSDFVLWKVKNDETIKFGNKLTSGRPGWHLECSVIVDNKLDKLHISIGGIDLMNPHHMCSICQSESFKPHQKYGDYWIHLGFLNFAGDKMSKSIGNIKRLEDIKCNYKLLRMYLLSKSYRNDFDFVESELQVLETDFTNLHLLYNKLKYKFNKQSKDINYDNKLDTSIYQTILNAVSNNFDVKSGLNLLFEYVSKFKKVYINDIQANEILIELNKVNKLFNILDENLLVIDDNTLETINKREELRRNRKFTESDILRQQIQNNYIFEDENTGLSLVKIL